MRVFPLIAWAFVPPVVVKPVETAQKKGIENMDPKKEAARLQLEDRKRKTAAYLASLLEEED